MDWNELQAKVLRRIEDLDPSDMQDAINEALDMMSRKIDVREKKDLYEDIEYEIAVTVDDTTVFDGSSQSFIDDTITFYKKLSGGSSFTLVDAADYTVSDGVVTMTTGNLDNGDTAKIVGKGSTFATNDYESKYTLSVLFKELFNIYVNDVEWTMKPIDIVKSFTDYPYYINTARDVILFADSIQTTIIDEDSNITIDATWDFPRVTTYLQEIDIPQSMEDCLFAGVLFFLYGMPMYSNEEMRKYYHSKFEAIISALAKIEDQKFRVPDFQSDYDYNFTDLGC